MLGVSGVFFHFYFISNRNSCEQTVYTLIRRRVLYYLPRSHKRDTRLIWVKKTIPIRGAVVEVLGFMYLLKYNITVHTCIYTDI